MADAHYIYIHQNHLEKLKSLVIHKSVANSMRLSQFIRQRLVDLSCKSIANSPSQSVSA